MRVYKVTRKGEGSFYTDALELDGVLADEADVGTSITIEVVDISPEQYDALPEFTGF